MPAMNAGGPVIAAPVPLVPAVIANPSAGALVTMDPFSGPKASLFDAKAYPGTIYMPVLADRVADPNNVSTGPLSTGIGFALGVSGIPAGEVYIIGATAGKFNKNYTDDYTPGVTKPDGTVSADATLLAIGGGRTNAVVIKTGDYSNTNAVNAPYTAAPLLGFGGGGSRDATAGVGFAMKTVTAAADVADAAVVETGFVNRTGGVVKTGATVFGSASAASVAPAMVEGPARSAPKNGEEQKKIEAEFDSKLKQELEHKPQAQPKK